MVSVSGDPAGGWKRERVGKKELMMVDGFVVVEAGELRGIAAKGTADFVAVQRLFWLVSSGYGDGMAVIWVGF